MLSNLTGSCRRVRSSIELIIVNIVNVRPIRFRGSQRVIAIVARQSFTDTRIRSSVKCGITVSSETPGRRPGVPRTPLRRTAPLTGPGRLRLR